MSLLRLSAGFHGISVKRWWGWSCSKQGTSPSATIHQWLASAFFLPQMSQVNETSQTMTASGPWNSVPQPYITPKLAKKRRKNVVTFLADLRENRWFPKNEELFTGNGANLWSA